MNNTSKVQHTAGPWTIRISPKGGWNIGDKHGNTSFAYVRDHYHNGIEDAHLIAAAPELLQTLRSVWENVDFDAAQTSLNLVRTIKDTIAKAESK